MTERYVGKMARQLFLAVIVFWTVAAAYVILRRKR